jgi:hypothetical protein
MMKLTRLIQVNLSIIFGHLTAVAVYDILLKAISNMIWNTGSNQDKFQLLLGILIIITSLTGIVSVWKKAFFMIFLTGVMLFALFLAFTIAGVIELANNYPELKQADKYKAISEITLKSIVFVISIFLSFYMSSRGPYTLVKYKEPSN